MVRKRLSRKARILSRVQVALVVFGLACVTAFVSSHTFKSSVLGTADEPTTHIKAASVENANGTTTEPLCGEVSVDCESNYQGTQDKIFWCILYMLAILYVFVGLAVVCDDFFVASLEVICDVLDLTPDVAGATFMAAGSSAPELFTSTVGVFVAKNDVGIGTILGSAVFNILVIIGLTGLLAGQTLQLDWKPLARDSLFYMFSIILVLLMFSNKRIDWYEALVCLVCYGLYLLTMKYNSRLMTFLDRIASPSYTVTVNPTPWDMVRITNYTPESVRPPSFRVVAHLVVANIRLQKSVQAKQQRESQQQQPADDDSDDGDILDFPDTAKDQLLFLIALPVLIAFKYTIPNCSEERLRKYYLVTFFVSILWIGIGCFFMVDWSRALGCVLDIDPALMGLTLLAAGTSVPDAMSSLFVAQDGEGDMAVSNAIGSNVFDILLGLGLPWTISVVLSGGEPISVCSQGIVKATVLLFVVLVFVVATLAFSGWQLSPRVGLLMFLGYFAFVTFSLLDEKLHLITSF